MRRASGVATAALCLVIASPAAVGAQEQELRWGGDAEGGAPFVEADRCRSLARRGLRRRRRRAARIGPRAPSPLHPDGLHDPRRRHGARATSTSALSGIEDTPARRSRLAVTIPYYEFREILTVRAADRDRFRSLADLRGRSRRDARRDAGLRPARRRPGSRRHRPGHVRRRRAPVFAIWRSVASMRWCSTSSLRRRGVLRNTGPDQPARTARPSVTTSVSWRPRRPPCAIG